MSRAERLVVFGIGSRLMRDDGIGPVLADRLQKEPHPGNWLICAAETDIAYAAGLRLPGDYVVLLDAVQAGNAPGTVYMVELQTGEWRKRRPASLHEPDAWQLVFEQPHSGGCLIGVEASDISPGIGLGPVLANAYESIYGRVKALLDKITQAHLKIG